MKNSLKIIINKICKHKIISVCILCFLAILAAPTKNKNAPYATAIFDTEQNLLGAHIATDGQWRFEPTDSVSCKFKKCITLFEDKNFEQHCGISIKAIVRAIYLNYKRNKIVSGGSTITMQVARLQRPHSKRTYYEKCIETLMALKLELLHSKKYILNNYASNAPFGNNVVGLHSASWRYFNKSMYNLSWAENATLAVLPNAPSVIYPGRNQNTLLKKRNKLLHKLLQENIIDTVTYNLALCEPLPTKPLPLPQVAPHYLQYCISQKMHGNIYTNIKNNLQQNAQQIAQQHISNMPQVGNYAILVTNNKTGKIICYIGNTCKTDSTNNAYVDCAQAPRSTGSILKPFMYASALQDGLITPYTLLPDVPMQFGSFNPKNYAKTYEGAVPAKDALAKSLNIPFAYILHKYGVQKFKDQLQNIKLYNINKSSNYYGLSLILGGAEENLFNLHNAYCSLAMQLNKPTTQTENVIFDNAIIYETFKAMQEVRRPDEQGCWKIFENTQQIAWKTGTSFGNRDAWAIGVNPAYTVSVWVGNAQGQGSNALTGFKAAAPIMFAVFNNLPKNNAWFAKPNSNINTISICTKSGMRSGIHCTTIDTLLLPSNCANCGVCLYHKAVANVQNNFTSTTVFELPPLMAKYYNQNKINFTDTNVAQKSKCIITYPQSKSTILISRSGNGSINPLVLDCIYLQKNKKLFWHLNNNYLGTTTDVHQLSIKPQVGNFNLKVITEDGTEQEVSFAVK